MPKDTFYNLPEEKRQTIYEAALDEFSIHPFKQASINRVVEAAGIAKGSFYQYFQDKKDLYKFLVEEIFQKKIAYLTPEMQNPFNMDCFSLIRELFRSGVRFAKDNPKLAKIAQHLMSNSEKDTYLEIMEEKKGEGIQIYKMILEKGMEKGDVRGDINLDIAAFFLFQLSNSLSDGFMDMFHQGDEAQLMERVEDMIEILKYGISNNRLESENE
ncbi:TetR/AcrR family transcriptional regulator [Alkalibacter rhizosphaerae]|uniref:TetR/AcrR family transcriptional regulator n=1 Tax=Alkalibacter rhizosphaerae TaxID=2815577 RepID=A0A974XKP7_9FIRM|nr:TetR/AcrR family transcriptional regulator [Alkalibacter rhizosphaerae]QSX07741.1 TetR/AcrR family transcriptional regulator [Alkalibacter rhizosphaerae]